MPAELNTKDEIWRLRQQAVRLSVQASTANVRANSARKERDQAIQARFLAEEEAAQLRAELSAERSTREALEKRVALLTSPFETVIDQNLALQDEIAQIRGLARLVGGYARLASEKDIMRQQISELGRDNDQLRRRNKILSRELGNLLDLIKRSGGVRLIGYLHNVPIFQGLVRRA